MQWHMPIGYKIIDGKIVIVKEEERTVKQIFESYVGGKSACAIAEQLKKDGIKNGKGHVSWTHASIGRILENHTYLGTEHHPALIDRELFWKAQQMREQAGRNYGRGQYRKGGRERELFYGKVICAECGAVYSRYQKIGKESGERISSWRCKNYIYQNKVNCCNVRITDEILFNASTQAMNRFIQNPRLLNQTNPKEFSRTRRYCEIEKKIVSGNAKSREEMMQLLQEKALEAYKGVSIDEGAGHTQRIKELLESREELLQFDDELFRQTIKKIVVKKERILQIIFQNSSQADIEF